MQASLIEGCRRTSCECAYYQIRRKISMKKRTICFILAAAMLFALSGAALAADYSYRFAITPPSGGSADTSGAATAQGGLRPWVNPEVSTVETTYWLFPADTTPGGHLASLHTLVTGSTGKQYFPGGYAPNYGGAGSAYKLAGACALDNFNAYIVSGTWSPD